MNGEKGKNILIIVLFIIIIGLIGSLFVIGNRDINLFSNVTEDKKNENNNSNNNNSNSNNQTKNYKFEKVPMDDCDFEKGCSIDFKGNHIEGKVSHNGNNNFQIVINVAKSYESLTPMKEIYAIDGYFLIVANQGTDLGNTEIGIVGSNGEVIDVISNLDSKYKSMYIDKMSTDSYLEIKDNKLIAKGSRVWHGPSIIMDEDNFSLKSPCELGDNEEIEGLYGIEYLGNGQFKVSNVSYNHLKDYEFRNRCNTVK